MTVADAIQSPAWPAPHAVRRVIANNDMLDDTLHVIAVISNPCNYARRHVLANQFLRRMQEEPNVRVYVVELVYYTHQPFCVARLDCAQHLQLRMTDVPPLWHKENLVNIGVAKLLPPTWKAMAWIDADIEFESHTWASDTLRVLNGHADIVQLFSHAVDMDASGAAMRVFTSFGYQYTHGVPWAPVGSTNFWHSGFAWAVTRRAYEKMGGLFELGVVGSGDMHMALACIGGAARALVSGAHASYRDALAALDARMSTLRLCYVPGVVRHYFHGSKSNRKYGERWKIFVSHGYDPATHITHEATTGVLTVTPACPVQFLADILAYFHDRKEDD